VAIGRRRAVVLLLSLFARAANVGSAISIPASNGTCLTGRHYPDAESPGGAAVMHVRNRMEGSARSWLRILHQYRV